MNNVPELYIDMDTGNLDNPNESFEWNEIELRTQIERRKSSVVVSSELEDDLNFNQLTIDELEDYFFLMDIQSQLELINPEIKVQKKNSFYNLINLILPCKIPKLKDSLILERDRVFAIALTPFENEHMNFRILITIYEILLQKKGYFTDKIHRLQQTIKRQNSIYSSSTNNLEAPIFSRRSSFHRFKHIRSFKLRNSFGNQSMRADRNKLNGKLTSLESAELSGDEFKKRNRSVDLSTLNNDKLLITNLDSELKYRLNDQDVTDNEILNNSLLNLKTNNTENSMESFQTSINSNLEYQSASAFSKFNDLNSNYLNGNFNSTDHLSINNGYLNQAYSTRDNSRKNSIRSAISLSGSRKSSNASYFNERISIELIHRSIQFGEHWKNLGFQGNDLTTDLRDLGLLSLFQLCFLLLTNEQLALQIYELSLDVEQNFPFALVGIQISQICLQTLRQGNLNRILNSRNEVFYTINNFYISLFLKFYQIWKEDKKTIMNSNDVLTELRILAATKPKQLMEKLSNFDSSPVDPKEEPTKLKVKIEKEEVLEFTDISKIAGD